MQLIGIEGGTLMSQHKNEFELKAEMLGCYRCTFRNFALCDHPGGMVPIVTLKSCPLVAEVRAIGKGQRQKVQKPDVSAWSGPRYAPTTKRTA